MSFMHPLTRDRAVAFWRRMAQGVAASERALLVAEDVPLVLAHAGMKQEMHGRVSAKVRDFGLFGETTGETDEFGLPVRYNGV